MIKQSRTLEMIANLNRMAGAQLGASRTLQCFMRHAAGPSHMRTLANMQRAITGHSQTVQALRRIQSSVLPAICTPHADEEK